MRRFVSFPIIGYRPSPTTVNRSCGCHRFLSISPNRLSRRILQIRAPGHLERFFRSYPPAPRSVDPLPVIFVPPLLIRAVALVIHWPSAPPPIRCHLRLMTCCAPTILLYFLQRLPSFGPLSLGLLSSESPHSANAASFPSLRPDCTWSTTPLEVVASRAQALLLRYLLLIRLPSLRDKRILRHPESPLYIRRR